MEGNGMNKRTRSKAGRRTAEKGFTLIELLVVMSILAVLAAMVFPTVSGMKTGGETASAKGDAKELENAINAFNTSSRTQSFPEAALACVAQTSDVYTMTVVNNAFATNVAKSVTVAKTSTGDSAAQISTTVASKIGLSPSCSGTLASHTQVDFDASTDVRQATGAVKSMLLIPDFLVSTPKSALWVRGTDIASASAADEYIWLLKKGSDTDAQGRTLQVLRLNTATPSQYEVARN